MKRVRIAMPHCGNKPFRVYMTVKYIASLRRAGAKVLRIRMDDPKLEEKVRSCDGLLLPGGGDIAPERYGQTPVEKCGKPHLLRDEAEWRLLTAFLPAGKPILGICRGHQVLNIALGGTLHQHIPTAEKHRGPGDAVHEVIAEEPSLFTRLYGSRFCTNSSHHQAIDRLGEGLSVTCVSDDGVVEGIIHENGNIIGVQFHPERMAFALKRGDAADGEPIFRLFAAML